MYNVLQSTVCSSAGVRLPWHGSGTDVTDDGGVPRIDVPTSELRILVKYRLSGNIRIWGEEAAGTRTGNGTRHNQCRDR